MSGDAAKVTSGHLRRDAYLYVRQSTMYQVIHNTESARRQYDLKGRAVALGWPVSQVHVIDIDQGSSGAPRPRTGQGSSSWSARCRWDGPGSCPAWNAPGWPATTRTGSS